MLLLVRQPDPTEENHAPVQGATTTTRYVAPAPSGTPEPTPQDDVEITGCKSIPAPFPINDRSCSIQKPRAALADERLPVVILLHGWNSQYSDVIANGGWKAALVQRHFMVVAPQGALNGWNAGGCCGLTQSTGVDDVGFLRQLIDQIKARPDVDPARVFMVGESNGGMMVYRYLCDGASTLAGAASVAGTSVAGCLPSQPISFMHVHGTADLTVPYQGGSSVISTLLGVSFAPVRKTLDAFAAAENCANPVDRPAGGATDTVWSCGGGNRLELVTVTGGTHDWPRVGVDATARILDFFGIR